jgi:hypothetical protein
MSDETITTPEIEVPTIPAAPATEAAETEDESGDTGEQNHEEASATSEGEPRTEQPPRKGGFQRKLDKEVAKRTTAEREAEFWRKEALRNRTAEEGKTEPKVEAADDKSNPEPKLADFDDWDAFNAANRAWMRKEAQRIADSTLSAAEKRRTEQEQKGKQDEETRKLNESFKTRDEKASKKHKDWVETVGDFAQNGEATVMDEMNAIYQSNPATGAGLGVIQQALIHSDPEGDLEYYLAKNLDEVARIGKLPTLQASLELGKLLGTKLAPQESSASTATAAGGTTKALPPPRTLSKTAPTATAAGADLKDDEYFARREKQIAEAQRKGRKR